MKIAIVNKKELDFNHCIELLNGVIDYDIVDNNPEYVFSFGGDGTFLDAVKQYGPNPIYVPINFGTLGFYTSWNKENINLLAGEIKKNKLIEAETLEVSLYKGETPSKTFICQNDATVLNPIQTLMLDVYINSIEVEHFRGTGICVSTPSGSTAYNKSLGGSIFSPTKRLFQLSHIAPINNVKFRNIGNSIVLDETEVLSMYPATSVFENTLLTIDRANVSLNGYDKIEFKLSNEHIKILVGENYNFYSRVKQSFID